MEKIIVTGIIISVFVFEFIRCVNSLKSEEERMQEDEEQALYLSSKRKKMAKKRRTKL